MTILGAWPEDKTYISWMTQRLANRAPEYTHARRWPFSIVQQILNPIGADIQRVNQQLTEERNNIFLTSANIDLVDKLYKVELGTGMKFNYTQNGQDTLFDIPKVYATIDDQEYELTIAKRNDIESLCYEALPSRIEDGEETYYYSEVIPPTQVMDLSSITPNSLVLDGHLFVTVSNNNTWEYRGKQKIYYPKVFIKGITRKDTTVTEALPIKFNGTFKTINQWKSIEEVFVSYIDDTAEISIEVLPFNQEDTMDTRNLLVSAIGFESWRFLSLGSKLWGSTLLSTGFTVGELAIIQSGMDVKDTEYEIELCDSNDLNISLNGSIFNPYNNFMLAVDNTKLYVFDTRLPYPDMKMLKKESTNTKMELWSERWVYPRDSLVYIMTDILDLSTVPWKYRWSLEEPDGQSWYVQPDGSKTSNASQAWTWNDRWESDSWKETELPVLLDKTGTYIVTLECLYSDPDMPSNDYILITRFMLYVPKIQPEIELDLPLGLQNADSIMRDSDGRLWFKIGDEIRLSNLYYDYFMADYSRNIVWLKENYTSVRVVI